MASPAKDAGTINQYFIGFLAAAVIFGAFDALRFYLVIGGESVASGLDDCVRLYTGHPGRAHGAPVLETTRVGEVCSV